MKLICIVLLTVLTLTSATTSYSGVNDVRSSNYAIVTTKIKKKWSFLFCKTSSKPLECAKIGKVQGYTEQELTDISERERTEAKWKTGTAVLVSVTAVATLATLAPAAGTFFLYTLFSGGQPLTVIIPVVATLGAAGSAPYWFDKTNPWHQFAQANALKTEGLLSSKDVSVQDKQVLELKELLEQILN